MRSFQREKVLGFTAIEMLITLGLFIVIITAVAAIFVRSLASERLISETVKLNDTISLALEQFTREVRTGYEFCAINCSSQVLNFRNVFGVAVTYSLGGDSEGGKIIRTVGGVSEVITGDEVAVEDLSFSAITGANRRARITLAITARPRSGYFASRIAPIRIQTTIAARNADN